MKKQYEIKEDILNVINISAFVQKKDEVLKRLVEEGTIVITLRNEPLFLLVAVTDDNVSKIASSVNAITKRDKDSIMSVNISKFIMWRDLMLKNLKKEGMIALTRYKKPFCLVVAVDQHNIDKITESIKAAKGENILNELRQNNSNQ